MWTVVVVLLHYLNVSLEGEDPPRKYTLSDCFVLEMFLVKWLGTPGFR